jgi:hypothetical protein
VGAALKKEMPEYGVERDFEEDGEGCFDHYDVVEISRRMARVLIILMSCFVVKSQAPIVQFGG